jgi:glycosyltransferase involved in cell wall biosynthesis
MTTLSKRLGVDGRVRFLGGVTDVARLYAASDVFVLPSLFETFGVVVVEALAAGLPVVVGRGAGAAGFVELEGAGRTVDVPADPEELASVIDEVYSMEQRMRSSGALAAERIRRREIAMKCSEGVVMERFLSLVDEAAAGTGRRG